MSWVARNFYVGGDLYKKIIHQINIVKFEIYKWDMS